MSRTAALTKRVIDNLNPSPTRYVVWDSSLAGFGARVSPSGRINYIARYRVGRRQREITLGRHGPMTPAEARAAAMSVLGDAGRGVDVLANRRRAEAAAENSFTVAEALDVYARDHLARLRQGREAERALRRELATMANVQISDLSSADIARLLSQKRRTAPVMANRLRDYVSGWATWMRDHGVIVHDFVPPKRRADRAVETSRERVLTDDELRRVWLVATATPRPWGPWFRLLIMTGQRRREVAGMCWCEIDLKHRTWVLPSTKTKNAKQHVVHLSAPALAALNEMAATRIDSCDFVFSKTGTSPISGFSKAKARIDAASGVKNWRIHDLRRTLVSHAADRGLADVAVLDLILNHSASATRGGILAVYQKAKMLPARAAALDAWAQWVDENAARCDR